MDEQKLQAAIDLDRRITVLTSAINDLDRNLTKTHGFKAELSLYGGIEEADARLALQAVLDVLKERLGDRQAEFDAL